ncbi:MAG: Fe-S cluster assembly ATPase SufC [Acidimicrobiia bacterium]|nr:Fe-S cluster assembly ATPase SufC [Acidimicrobiia bacterium]
MSEPLLQIENLRVTAGNAEILHGVDLTVGAGEIHALMGPNGSGKSTLANVLLGHPHYRVTGGRILFKGVDITGETPDARARRGLFLAFQYPEEIPGVSVVQFLRQALSNRTGIDLTVLELRLRVMEAMKDLGIASAFADRYLNEGFSGGERKRNEVLQMAVLQPELAVLDETDSGLDIDALRTVAEGVNKLTAPDRGGLIITHYQRLLDYVTPHRVHILIDGRIVDSGGPELATTLEAEGYEAFRNRLPT